MSDQKSSPDFSLVLASSVHDMKSSIGMLLSSLEGIIEETPPENPAQRKRYNSLHYEASRINSELVQLLTIYRMQNELLPVRVDQHYVIDVLEDQVARNHALLDSGQLKFTMRCDDQLHWFYDSDLIGSVVHNILVNCIRYTKSAITISAEVDEDFLRIVVADDGPGYPKHMLERPSGQVDSADVANGATHLGLYFAEQIAAKHKQNGRHGYITLENNSELGGGAFTLYIP